MSSSAAQQSQAFNKELLLLAQHVREICQCSLYGGRTFLVRRRLPTADEDENHATAAAPDTCMVVDVDSWTDEMLLATRARFPDVQISIQHLSCSLTGFCVALTLPPPPHRNESSQITAKSSKGAAGSSVLLHRCMRMASAASKGHSMGNIFLLVAALLIAWLMAIA